MNAGWCVFGSANGVEEAGLGSGKGNCGGEEQCIYESMTFDLS
jgi:hypothetical protein